VVYYCFTHISYIFQITIDYIELWKIPTGDIWLLSMGSENVGS
jgi:hypothetical protein